MICCILVSILNFSFPSLCSKYFSFHLYTSNQSYQYFLLLYGPAHLVHFNPFTYVPKSNNSELLIILIMLEIFTQISLSLYTNHTLPPINTYTTTMLPLFSSSSFHHWKCNQLLKISSNKDTTLLWVFAFANSLGYKLWCLLILTSLI